jgi:hypothetical protein
MKPWAKNKRLDAAVTQLMAFAAKFERGETIALHDMAEASGVSMGERLFHQLRAKFRRAMRDQRGIAVRSIPGVGYKLLDDAEAATLPFREAMIYGGRLVKRKRLDTECARQSHLGLHEQRALAIRGQYLAANEKRLRGDYLRATNATRPTETLPKRPV